MPEDVEIHSTKARLEDFKESTIWGDIERELKAWAEGFRREQDALVDEIAGHPEVSAAHVLTHLGDLHGRLEAVRYFLSLPDILLEYLTELKKEDSNPEEEVSDE